MDFLLRIAKWWVQPELHIATEVVEVMDHFLRAVPPEERKAVGMRGASNPQ